MNLKLDVAAEAKGYATSAVSGVKSGYFAEATVSWTFNGTGNVAYTPPKTFTWTADGAKVTNTSDAWQAVGVVTSEDVGGELYNNVIVNSAYVSKKAP